MIVIPLEAIPNQSLSIQLDNNNIDINIHSCNNTPQTYGTNIMAIDITINEIVIITGQRMVPAWPLIGYDYLSSNNFFIVTENDEYGDYTQFGVTQYLIYVNAQEIQEILAGTFVYDAD
jgi:hypothetical protein